SSLSSHSPSLTLLPPPPRSPLFPYTTLFRSTLMPGPSLADVGYFTLPVFAFAALLVLATDGSRSEPGDAEALPRGRSPWVLALEDRKSTRLNSSHRTISYAVFCLKKKKKTAW